MGRHNTQHIGEATHTAGGLSREDVALLKHANATSRVSLFGFTNVLMHVCAYVCQAVCLWNGAEAAHLGMGREARRRHWIPGSWSYKHDTQLVNSMM